MGAHTIPPCYGGGLRQETRELFRVMEPVYFVRRSGSSRTNVCFVNHKKGEEYIVPIDVGARACLMCLPSKEAQAELDTHLPHLISELRSLEKKYELTG